MDATPTLAEICTLFGCAHVDALDALYLKHDQELMYNFQWDYQDDALLTNRIRTKLELLDVGAITDEYDRWRVKEILWLWYHHAISCALWRYGDEEAARAYATKALEYHQTDNPNKITMLLYLLVHRRTQEAQEYATSSIDTDVETDTATYLLDLYKEGAFFNPQVLDGHSD